MQGLNHGAHGVHGAIEKKLSPCTPWWMLFLAAILLSACARPPQLHQREAFVFGTRVEVSVWGESADKAAQALAAVLAEFDRLHRLLHAWQPSELTTLNEAIARGEGNIAVSAELTFLLKDAADIAARSDQLFNPAIGRLVALWGFHSDEFRPQLPDMAAVEAVGAPEARLRRPAANIAIGQAEYLVIAHPDFMDELEPLAAARRAEGLTVKVVDGRGMESPVGTVLPGRLSFVLLGGDGRQYEAGFDRVGVWVMEIPPGEYEAPGSQVGMGDWKWLVTGPVVRASPGGFRLSIAPGTAPAVELTLR